MNLIDQEDGAADFNPSCTFAGLSSWKKLLAWRKEGDIYIYGIALMDLFGSTELVYVLHKVPVVPDVSELVMDQHFKQPAVMKEEDDC